MNSASFLARWEAHLNSKNNVIADDNAELPLAPQVEENQVDSAIVCAKQLNNSQIG